MNYVMTLIKSMLNENKNLFFKKYKKKKSILVTSLQWIHGINIFINTEISMDANFMNSFYSILLTLASENVIKSDVSLFKMLDRIQNDGILW